MRTAAHRQGRLGRGRHGLVVRLNELRDLIGQVVDGLLRGDAGQVQADALAHVKEAQQRVHVLVPGREHAP